jgi:hypothetical protein
VDAPELFACRNIKLAKSFAGYDLIVKAVPHDEFTGLPHDHEVMSYRRVEADVAAPSEAPTP